MSAESYFARLAGISEAGQAPPCERIKELATLVNVAIELNAELDEKVCALYAALGYRPARNLAGDLVACQVRKEGV